MSRKKIVAGNWKMNMTIDESNDLINELKEVSENNVEIKIAPSFTNLYNAISLLKNPSLLPCLIAFAAAVARTPISTSPY